MITQHLNAHLYDLWLQKEMNVIITVLNRLFDEDNDMYYIGSESRIYSVHNQTNNTLNVINRYNNHYTRRNKGKKLYPPFSNSQNNIIIRRNHAKRGLSAKSQTIKRAQTRRGKYIARDNNTTSP